MTSTPKWPLERCVLLAFGAIGGLVGTCVVGWFFLSGPGGWPLLALGPATLVVLAAFARVARPRATPTWTALVAGGLCAGVVVALSWMPASLLGLFVITVTLTSRPDWGAGLLGICALLPLPGLIAMLQSAFSFLEEVRWREGPAKVWFLLGLSLPFALPMVTHRAVVHVGHAWVRALESGTPAEAQSAAGRFRPIARAVGISSWIVRADQDPAFAARMVGGAASWPAWAVLMPLKSLSGGTEGWYP